MKTILAVETSTHACSAALVIEQNVFDVFALAPREHTNLLLSQVDTVLEQAGCKLADVDLFAFGAGPGSFMGLRLAASVAQAFAYSQHKPALAVSSLQALAQQAYLEHGFESVYAAWDARMQEIYAGRYHLTDGVMTAMSHDALYAPEDLPSQNDFTLIGNAFAQYLQQDAAVDLYPRAREVALLAQQSLIADMACTAALALPNYVRHSVTS